MWPLVPLFVTSKYTDEWLYFFLPANLILEYRYCNRGYFYLLLSPLVVIAIIVSPWLIATMIAYIFLNSIAGVYRNYCFTFGNGLYDKSYGLLLVLVLSL